MSGKPVKDIQRELGKLRQTYLKRLTGSVGELRRMQVLLASSVQVPLADLQHIYKLSNDLAGSGATYGFPNVSQTARVLNSSVKAFIEIDNSSPPLRRETLYNLELFQSACMDALQAKPANSVNSPAAMLKDKVIAIISNNETMTGFYSHVLQQTGASVLPVARIESVTAKTDILILDLSEKTQAATMKLAELRKQQPGLSVILLLDKERLSAAETLIGQVDDLLFNPFTPESLQLVIANRLANKFS